MWNEDSAISLTKTFNYTLEVFVYQVNLSSWQVQWSDSFEAVWEVCSLQSWWTKLFGQPCLKKLFGKSKLHQETSAAHGTDRHIVTAAKSSSKHLSRCTWRLVQCPRCEAIVNNKPSKPGGTGSLAECCVYPPRAHERDKHSPWWYIILSPDHAQGETVPSPLQLTHTWAIMWEKSETCNLPFYLSDWLGKTDFQSFVLS